MSLVTLADVLQPALKNGYAVAGLVTLGWEDMRAFVAAADAVGEFGGEGHRVVLSVWGLVMT